MPDVFANITKVPTDYRMESLTSWIDRGADALVRNGAISSELREALKKEGRLRAEQGGFFGYPAYASLIARAPI